MNDRKRFLYLMLIMTTVALLVMGITDYILYRAAYKEGQERLVETVQSQARLMEAMARFDAIYSNDYPDGSYLATVSKIIEAHKNYKGFGKTGEFTLARLVGDSIVFLLSHRHYDLEKPQSISFNVELAEPMRLALSGKSGTIVGLDYRGENVLAAYEPVAILHLGLVAKIDLSEIRAPFIRASLIAFMSAFMIVLIGSLLFLRISNPVLRRLQEYAERLEKMVAKRTKKLQDSEVRLTEAQRIAHLGSWEWNIIDNSEIWSDEQFHIFGYNPGEITPTYQHFLDAIHPEDSDFVIDTIQKTLYEKQSYQIEFRIIRPNKEVRTILAQGQVYRDQQDKPIRMIGTVQDITERKQAEDELNKLSSAIQQSADCVIITDKDGVIEFVNPAFEITTGFSKEEAIGKTPRILKSGEHDAKFYEELWETILSGKVFRAVFTNKRKNGELFWDDRTITPVKDNRGDITHLIATGRDITERKKVEEEVYQSREQLRALTARLQSIREEEQTRISRELHDELGHLLTALKIDLVALSKDPLIKSKPQADDLQSMISLTDHSLQTVKRIATELRPGVLDHLGIGAAIEWQSKEFQSHTQIKCEVRLPEERIGLNKDKDIILFRILQESLTNVARHAQATNIVITLKMEKQSISMIVQDDGRGIEESEVVGMRSLGLLGMQERAHLVGGKLTITGEQGKGTTISVSVPMD